MTSILATPPPTCSDSQSIAIFGYGSLLFKPPPYDLESEAGYIKGFKRRFAQDSHDHRGTPENPGRVVTLVTEEDWELHRRDEPAESGHVWGRVYRIPPSQATEIWAYLDHREKDGYTQRRVDVYGLDAQGQEVVIEHSCRVYVGELDNPSFAGGTPMRELARKIATAHGPSGPNKEYLYLMTRVVRELGPDAKDEYLHQLEGLVHEIDPDWKIGEA
ncbi:BZ3500_MvSof-1268-A1-R1_Chr5-2g07997 [Microbotryum saponariae]|uniref:glutathione-specific gamma-glutamylcyclotransferase n=1 Tax=Microbotryum saponariae TaxID=289078 RepID=A0A2X0NJB3_9BASI|nr:BZ3500_MvSof-1268-A1-R1_Chr5-2g07997 [Microbotryum saponariae]SDA05866.1 BZ3501_MvSof-1269-A2-R1_Chr5-2g07819 [Microbotryum saponariae]